MIMLIDIDRLINFLLKKYFSTYRWIVKCALLCGKKHDFSDLSTIAENLWVVHFYSLLEKKEHGRAWEREREWEIEKKKCVCVKEAFFNGIVTLSVRVFLLHEGRKIICQRCQHTEEGKKARTDLKSVSWFVASYQW